MNGFRIKTVTGYSIVDLDKLVMLEIQRDKGILNFQNGGWIECSLAEAKAIERGFESIKEAETWRAKCISPIQIKAPSFFTERYVDLQKGDFLYEKSYGCYLHRAIGSGYEFEKKHAVALFEELKKYPDCFIIEDYRDDKAQ